MPSDNNLSQSRRLESGDDKLDKYSEIYLKFKNRKFKKKNEDPELDKLEHLNEDEFKRFIQEFEKIHLNKCGKDCPHLKRFYEKIGYVEDNTFRSRAKMKLKKTIIESLPKIHNF